MIKRLTLVALATALTLTGCTKHATPTAETDFTNGPTLVTVTSVPARTADGETVYVTLDGTDAGTLATGESIELRVPAGSHQVGGYARSLIGRVTIPSVKITTTPDSAKHVAYTVANRKPTFTELAADPAAQPKPAPAPQATPTQTTAPEIEAIQASQG